MIGSPFGPSFEADGVFKQYTDKVLMVFNPAAPNDIRYSLEPLGRKLNLPEPQRDIPDANGVVIDGIVIYDKFYPLYESLGLTKYGGRPLSQPGLDPNDYNRIVQYFENVGFYTYLDDPAETVHLIDYGKLLCDQGCSAQGPLNAAPIPQIFLERLRRLGTDLTGSPLSGYYLAQDSNFEQVYENVVVYAAPDDILGIRFRALPALIGIAEAAPVPEENDPRLIFKATQGDLGHNIPIPFMEYILSHGGFDVSGEPITERFASGGIFRQCFQNYCLDFDPNSPSGVAPVRPAALGTLYIQQHPVQPQASPNPGLVAKNILVNVWESKPRLASTERETIYLQVRLKEDEAPLAHLAAKLTVTQPDGGTAVYIMQPTDSEGITSYNLPAIPAKNGRLVPYQVCLIVSSDEPICGEDSFIIWNNP